MWTRTAGAAIALALAACGGGTPTAPTSPAAAPLPTATLCGATTGAKSSAFIFNGTSCDTTATSVVLLNLSDGGGNPYALCSGTVISPRAVLTAAHCLPPAVAKVQIYLGDGPQLVATSFSAAPGYSDSDPNALDVGIVTVGQDIGRAAVPLLLSRDARVGETAIVAGWGKDQNLVIDRLHAGSTTISAVGTTYLQTQPGTSSAGVCSGDSGGPLLVNENGAWAVAGVTSAVGTSGACNSGTNYYANVRNPGITSFVLGLVPDAARR